MLSETRSEVSCLDLGLKNGHGTFKLDVSGIKHLDTERMEGRPNSRGEGIIS